MPIGYGDGWRRRLSNRHDVLIGGRRHRSVGNVSMDNITVELGPDTGVEVGDDVVLIGTQGDERILAEEVARTPPLPLRLTGVMPLGRGTALRLEAPEALALRARLAAGWASWLSAQDRQGWRPHVTVQNKVGPAEARALQEELRAGFAPWAAVAEGLLLWRYRGGPWEEAGRFGFAG